MKIVFIGSGNVATVLARMCVQHGHEILQVLSRNLLHAQTIAQEVGATHDVYTGNINTSADIYIVSINDTALFNLSKYFSLGNKLVVHTAGSVNKDVLQNISTNYGVLYPFQSLRKEMDYIPEIPFMIDGNTPEALNDILSFAKTLTSLVHPTSDDERSRLHVAAVAVNNFTNHLYMLAEDYCKKENLDFSLLHPLIIETANRVKHESPKNMQTGPALRNDTVTLDKHLRLLANHPKLKYLYLKFTDSIMNP
jgi:predicted short-subunit dehydrogenase-like oxidoreductase (DUF2520 family)